MGTFVSNHFSCTDQQPLPLNMKLVILFALLAVAAAAPQQAVLRSSEARMNPDGSYKFSYEIDDGTRAVESGEQKQITVVVSGTVSRGQYTFVSEGVRYTVDWVADENGFVVKEFMLNSHMVGLLQFPNLKLFFIIPIPHVLV